MKLDLNVEETILVFWGIALLLNVALGVYGAFITSRILKKRKAAADEPYTIGVTRHPGFAPAIVHIRLTEPVMLNVTSSVVGSEHLHPDRMTNVSPEKQEELNDRWQKIQNELKDMQKGNQE